jgi:uncharacterized protein
MDIARSIALFGVAVVAEIGGACLVWHRMKRELLAADVTWGDSRPPPAVRVKRGAEEIAAYFARLQKANFQAEPLVTAAQGDYVIDVHRGWPSYDDATLDTHWVLVYRIEAGRIAEVENYAADQHAADLFFTRVWGEDLKPIPGPVA